MINNMKGFTLIETLVAIMILTTAIVGPLTIAQKGLSATLVAKDQVTAFYLAQDAIEYVRFIRDTNRLRGAGWLAGLDGTANGHSTVDGVSGECVSADGSNVCSIDSLNDIINSCQGSCPAINYDSQTNGGYFTYATVNGSTIMRSLFTRTITVKTVQNDAGGNPVEASVVVVVSWRDTGGVLRSVSVDENIFNWQ